MARRNQRIEETKRQAKRAARSVGPWIDRIARTGYVAKGVIYATIGVLALREVLGEGGATTGPIGAMRSMGPPPLDSVLLIVLAIRLLGYAMWKLVQGIMDPDDKGSDAHGILRRVGTSGVV